VDQLYSASTRTARSRTAPAPPCSSTARGREGERERGRQSRLRRRFVLSLLALPVQKYKYWHLRSCARQFLLIRQSPRYYFRFFFPQSVGWAFYEQWRQGRYHGYLCSNLQWRRMVYSTCCPSVYCLLCLLYMWLVYYAGNLGYSEAACEFISKIPARGGTHFIIKNVQCSVVIFVFHLRNLPSWGFMKPQDGKLRKWNTNTIRRRIRIFITKVSKFKFY
jgi:hypothetical protein